MEQEPNIENTKIEIGMTVKLPIDENLPETQEEWTITGIDTEKDRITIVKNQSESVDGQRAESNMGVPSLFSKKTLTQAELIKYLSI
jgi:hypothetical protein